MPCLLTIDSMVGTRTAANVPPYQVVAQGTASCSLVNVVFDSRVTADSPASPDGRSFPNVPAPGGRWTLVFPPVATLACGSRLKLTISCVDDVTCSVSTQVNFDCVVQPSQCPQVVLVTPVVDPCDSSGRKPATLEAIFTNVAAGTSVYWDFGDGNYSAPHAVTTPSDDWILNNPKHLYFPGSYVAMLKSFSPAGCADFMVPVEVSACEPACPNVQLKIANTGDCDDHARRLVTIGATVQNAAPGTSLQLDYGDGNFSEVRSVSGNQDITFAPHPFLPPGPYEVKAIVVSPAGCPGSNPLEVRDLRSCGSNGGTATGGNTEDNGTYPPRSPRPWYCAWLEAIWMFGFIWFLVLSLVTLCVGLAGAQVLAQTVVTGLLFWFWVGFFAVSVQLLISFTLTALGIAVIALFLWIRLCHPSRCRILGDFCWVLFWSSMICGVLATSVGGVIPPVFLYPLLLGLVYAGVSDYTRAQGCVEPDKYSLPFLR